MARVGRVAVASAAAAVATAAAAAALAALALLLPTGASAALPCTFAMQSGDVSPTTAIIQASVSQDGCRSPPFLALTSNVTVRVCTVAPGARGVGGGGGGSRCTAGTVLHTTVVARAYVGVDPRVYPGAYTVKVFLDGLTPATAYAYEFVAESGATSPTGTFRTLPPPEEEGEVAFLHISCANENPYPVAGVLGNLTAPGSDYAFLLQNGDSVYADRFWLRGKNYTEVDRCCAAPTPSLDYYRSLYADQRDAVYTSAGFPDMQRQIPIFTSIDDHHVNDNYAGNGGDPRTIQEVFPPGRGTPLPVVDVVPPHLMQAYYLYGYQALFEMNALPPAAALAAADPVGGLPDPARRLFRKFRVGRHVEVFLTDLRQYRDPPTPAVGLLPVLPPNVTAADLCAPANGIIAALCAALPPPAAPRAPSTLRDANASLLGAPQKAWLLGGLAASTATWKVVVSSVQILEYFAAPADRWEGYWRERAEVLAHIEGAGIANVLFLVGDVHASIFSRVNPGRTPPIHEVTTGPVGRSTFGAAAGPLAAPLTAFLYKYGANGHLQPGAGGADAAAGGRPVKFAAVDTPNFMAVRVSAGGGVLTVRTLDAAGEVVVDGIGNRGELALTAE